MKIGWGVVGGLGMAGLLVAAAPTLAGDKSTGSTGTSGSA